MNEGNEKTNNLALQESSQVTSIRSL